MKANVPKIKESLETLYYACETWPLTVLIYIKAGQPNVFSKYFLKTVEKRKVISHGQDETTY